MEFDDSVDTENDVVHDKNHDAWDEQRAIGLTVAAAEKLKHPIVP